MSQIKYMHKSCDDFTKAYELLENTGGPAKITKDAVAHYLAKHTYRASEINDAWNSATRRPILLR